MWNYFLSSICLSASYVIDLLINRLNTQPDAKGILSIPYSRFEQFFSDGKIIIVLLIYGLLLFVLFRHSKIEFHLPQEDVTQKILTVVMVPLTVISMVLALQIAILGIQIIDINALQEFARTLWVTSWFLYGYIVLTPVWMFIHGLLTIWLTTSISLSYHSE